MVFYVDSQKSSSAEEIAFLLNKCILQYPGRWSELVFLCIGSDRVTGDCLGPYIKCQHSPHKWRLPERCVIERHTKSRCPQ